MPCALIWGTCCMLIYFPLISIHSSIIPPSSHCRPIAPSAQSAPPFLGSSFILSATITAPSFPRLPTPTQYDRHCRTHRDPFILIQHLPHTLTKRNSLNRGVPCAPAIPIGVDGRGGFAITFVHLGRKFYHLTCEHICWPPEMAVPQESIMKQQELLKK